MFKRQLTENIYACGGHDFDRRLFDSLIPLPDGTTYNVYLIKGSEKTVLIDTVDPAFKNELLAQLEDVDNIDFIISNHSEQDHSGSIPCVLEKYPESIVLASEKGKGLLIDHLKIDENRIRTVTDGETISIGEQTLKFIYTPWVHWPETMVTYLEEEQILFTCDFFGAHIADPELFVKDKPRVYEAAKRYFAEIMMPFRSIIDKNLEKLKDYPIRMICPSHGQVYDDPQFIIDAYKSWVRDQPRNSVVIPWVSMHENTALLVNRLVASLLKEGVSALPFNLTVTDIGKLAMALVDAGSIVIGTPTVLAGPHPLAVYAAVLANALKPKAAFVSVVGSYGWGGRAVETLASLIPNLKAEILTPVLCKGAPDQDDFNKIDELAATIAAKHREKGYI